MGSFRRGLIFFFALAPSIAFAEVCDKERPAWNGVPVSAWEDLIFLSTHVLFWPVWIALAAAIVLKRTSLTIIAGTIAALHTLLQLSQLTDTITRAAIREGCIASPPLFIGLCAAICLASIYLALRRRRA